MAAKFQQDSVTGQHYRDPVTGKKVMAEPGAKCCCKATGPIEPGPGETCYCADMDALGLLPPSLSFEFPASMVTCSACNLPAPDCDVANPFTIYPNPSLDHCHYGGNDTNVDPPVCQCNEHFHAWCASIGTPAYGYCDTPWELHITDPSGGMWHGTKPIRDGGGHLLGPAGTYTFAYGSSCRSPCADVTGPATITVS